MQKYLKKHHWAISDSKFSVKAKEILEGKSELAKFVADDMQVSPGKLDIWWASFFATGEDAYLDKIYRYAGEKLPKSDVKSMFIIGAATWSFKANCRQHLHVLEYAKRKIYTETGEKLKFLQESITYANSGYTSQLANNDSVEKGGWITRDGKSVPNSNAMKSINGFGGWLVVTSDKDWEEKWNTSPDTIPRFSESKDVLYGEQLTILTFL